MGSRGPLPKRDAQSVRRRAGTANRASRVESFSPCAVPPPDKRNWDAQAVDWYVSLDRSGESEFFEPSDWQFARIVAAMLTQLFERPSAELFKAVDAAMDKLGTTESARRRNRTEVDRPRRAKAVEPEAEGKARTAIRERFEQLAAT